MVLFFEEIHLPAFFVTLQQKPRVTTEKYNYPKMKLLSLKRVTLYRMFLDDRL